MEEDFLRSYNLYRSIDTKLNALKDSLSFSDQVNLELLRHQVNDELSQYKYKAYLNTILSDEGFHTSLARRGNTILSSKKDAERYNILLKDIPRYVDEHIALMREGLKLGISQPKNSP